jgi:tRNA 2-thiouridine synthesizing protein E
MDASILMTIRTVHITSGVTMDMTIATPIQRDGEGYLIDPENWNKELAIAIAQEERLQLTDLTWSIIEFMREYWLEHQVAPDVRHVVDYLTDTQEMDKKSAKDALFKLFPYGYVKQACKVAGMMRPRAWSTG